MNTRIVALRILDQILGLVGVGVAVFWSAGRMDWWPAWAAIAVLLAWFVVEDVVVLRLDPGLIAERLKPPRGAKAWDRAIVSIARLTQLARYILSGLDQRYGWTGGVPLAAQVSGLIVCNLGQALFTWAMASNTFFSQILRIQSDRDHVAVTGGPYRYVRHPGYVGAMMFEFGVSALLASWWSLIAAGFFAVLFILRTALEDRTLQAGLPGYVDYARQVRYRLLPGIW
jgi:protein-S-isoprenylcysteine O-methyltransferase Ste14